MVAKLSPCPQCGTEVKRVEYLGWVERDKSKCGKLFPCECVIYGEAFKKIVEECANV